MQNSTSSTTTEATSVIAPEVRLWLRLFAITFIIMQIGRIAFISKYPAFYHSLTAWELVQAWLNGFRFDIASVLMTITLPSLIMWFPLPRAYKKFLRTVAFPLSILALFTAATFIWSDLLYYEEAGHHITFEAKGITNDIDTMLKLIIVEYPIYCIVLLMFWAAMVWSLLKSFRAYTADNLRFRTRWWWRLSAVLLWIAVTIFGIRGGFQLKPMRMVDAFRGNNMLAGHLVLNGWYTFVTSAFAREAKIVNLVPPDEAYATTRSLLQTDADHFLADDYPLYRETAPIHAITTDGSKPNVCLILVESLTAAYLKSFGGDVQTMPFLDSLTAQSVQFKNCYSIGTRSMEGLSAILLSIPNLMGTPFMGSSQEQTKVKGIGTLFREQGYQTMFMHAALPGSMNIQQIAELAGYERFIHRFDFPDDNYDGQWGVWDRHALKRLQDEMDKAAEPFHYGIFTISTHTPFMLPPEFKPPFPKSMPKQEMYNSFANFDVELRKFFEVERTKPRFMKTIYVLIGDHTSQMRPDGTNDRFRVGALIYAPGYLQPRVEERPVSQLDLQPTLLDICGLQPRHASFGRSMFDTTKSRVAYFTQAELAAWRTEKLLFTSNLEHDLRLIDPIGDPQEKIDLLPTDAASAKEMRRQLYGFYQTAELLLMNSKLLPMFEQKK